MVFGRAHGHQVSIQRLCDKEMVWSDEGQGEETTRGLGGIKFCVVETRKRVKRQRIKKKAEQYVTRKGRKKEKGENEIEGGPRVKYDNMEKEAVW